VVRFASMERQGRWFRSLAWEIVTSVREFGPRVIQRWWALIVVFVGGVLGLISLTVLPSPHYQALVPVWLWLTIVFAGLLLSAFLAFHDVRKERDDVRGEMATRFSAIRYRFGLDSNGGLEVLEYEIETLVISVGGHGALPGGQFQSTKSMILPGRAHGFTYHWIPAPFTDPLPFGRGEYSVVYGHPTGGPKFRTHHEFTITWEIEEGKPKPLWLTRGVVTHELVSEEDQP
jgi:hypothetical protein